MTFKSILNFLKGGKEKKVPSGPLKFEYRILSKQVEEDIADFEGRKQRLNENVLYSVRVKDVSGYTSWGNSERYVAYNTTYNVDRDNEGFYHESLEDAQTALTNFLNRYSKGITLNVTDHITTVSSGVHLP